MWFGIISIFPEMFQALQYGISGRAIDKGLVQLDFWNPRDFSEDKHRRVDDRPYGGGPGMVMQAPPLQAAIDAAKARRPEAKVIFLSPQGRLLTQTQIKQFAQHQPDLILLSGRYEGIDERLLTLAVDEEWSIGDYVLSGGELPSMVLMDAIIRHLPGAVGHPDAVEHDSFSQAYLDYPQYTRPLNFKGLEVPAVLCEGNHTEIAKWRLQESIQRTWQRRPDLASQIAATADQTVSNDTKKMRNTYE
ncbi:MAG: tRNA (guanosine(37)-N1)-methyltransferase TrmD [Gammaproteobacteria bacterium]